MERSAIGAGVSVSVAELLPGVGSITPGGVITVAVLASEPVREAAGRIVTVKASDADGASVPAV